MPATQTQDFAKAQAPFIIVVGVDYSAVGDLALERAFETAAEKRNADVHIVHVLPAPPALNPLDFGAVLPAQDPGLVESATSALRAYADKRLQAFQALHAGSQRLFRRAVSHLRFDAPAHELAQIASDLEADLVIVGTHGRQGAARWLLGSVAEQVVRIAPCPVLVARPKHVDESVPKIEPACPRCVQARQASGGEELWCSDHRQRHGERHHYHYSERVGADTNFPLFVPQR